MRPPRLVLLLLACIALPILLTFLSLLSAHPRDGASTAEHTTESSRIKSLFSFHTPSSLFPPSAIISLTDDNSTFFLARPAAFGPVLFSDGLSGQLWVGSGFGEDSLRKGGATSGPEGELGCSDVPGWAEGDKKPSDEQQAQLDAQRKTVTPAEVNPEIKTGNKRRSELATSLDDARLQEPHSGAPSKDDGTDDHLHHPLPESDFSPSKPGEPANHEPIEQGRRPTHADIQSLQESAEIAGKVVLLSRGGCGFLEKVKWVQRRGGMALIVGDDARGGPLITMYARGDTSNVTIPSLFTSHTTAHLLSSLIPPDSDDPSSEDATKPRLNDEKPATKGGPKKNTKISNDRPNFTPIRGAPNPTSIARPSKISTNSQKNSGSGGASGKDKGWLSSFLSAIGFGGDSGLSWHVSEDSRRPPSSGHLDWVLLEDWNDGTPARVANKGESGIDEPAEENQGSKLTTLKSSTSQQHSGDDFVIGVQDWRDPDLVAPVSPKIPSKAGSRPNKATKLSQPTQLGTAEANNGGQVGSAGLKGGSITPGSGEYGSSDQGLDGKGPVNPDKSGQFDLDRSSNHHVTDGDGWFSQLNWGEDDNDEAGRDRLPAAANRPHGASREDSASLRLSEQLGTNEEDEEHEGLWVTLTPTSMSSSPFFDTLLVLVVSPLITLTVVYALLLLRSRIRRRRWRAPKSVVDRLPVRTYHTMSCSSSSSSSQYSTPVHSTPTSPLLRSAPRTISSPRPRSQTTPAAVPQSSSNASEPALGAAISPQEKSTPTSTSWQRRYTGRQVECVVCLEEYVDGQSRVMSLPCGHEFHVDCM